MFRWFTFGLALGGFLGLTPGASVGRGGGRADGRLLVRGALREVLVVQWAVTCARMGALWPRLSCVLSKMLFGVLYILICLIQVWGFPV